MRNKIFNLIFFLGTISLFFLASSLPIPLFAKMTRTTPPEKISQTAGMGIAVQIIGGAPIIVYVKPDGPAAGAGIKIEDKIMEVDGVLTQGIEMKELLKLIRGTPGTSIKLRIISKDSSSPREVTLERYLYSFTREENQIIQSNSSLIIQESLTKITQRTFNKNYNDIWRAAILYLASSEYPLQISDKDSGLIQTQISYVVRGYGGIRRAQNQPLQKELPLGGYVSQITFAKEGFLFDWYIAKESLTLTIIPTKEEGQTLVKVKFNVDGWTDLYGWQTLISNGTIEQKILDGISFNLQNEK